jgi:hypothetical protein
MSSSKGELERRPDMVHESLLVVTAHGESIGKIIHHDGDDTFLVEGEMVFPRDFAFHYESNVALCEDGALLYTLTDADDEPVTEATSSGPTREAGEPREGPPTRGSSSR